MKPGPLPLGNGRRLVLGPGLGEAEARAALGRELAAQVSRGGYFNLTDNSRFGAPPDVAGARVELTDDEPSLQPGDIGVRLDLSEAPASCSDSGAAVPVGCKATALTLRAHLFAAAGAFLVNGAAFTAVAEPGEAAKALAEVVAAFLKAITPVEVTRWVELDGSDGDQTSMLQAAADGQVARAREELRFYAVEHQDNAAAWFNLGVLTEALGQQGEARRLFQRAIALRADRRYREALGRCDAALLAGGETASVD
ncbi:MAG: hypothetical protein HY903_18770 [Deltaproteobacteria bacterium]|nr:hypothetical protein [Deltaproteobacteria bacterium]